MTPAQDPFYIVKDEIQDSVSRWPPARPHIAPRSVVSFVAYIRESLVSCPFVRIVCRLPGRVTWRYLLGCIFGRESKVMYSDAPLERGLWEMYCPFGRCVQLYPAGCESEEPSIVCQAYMPSVCFMCSCDLVCLNDN
jgi:hypothetical protein